MNGQIDWQAQQISHLVCSLAGQRCSEAWGTFSARTSQSITALTAWRKEEWRKEAADIPPSKAENDLCSTRQILALFRGQPWGDCWETGRSAYGPFRALRCHLELKLKLKPAPLPPQYLRGHWFLSLSLQQIFISDLLLPSDFVDAPQTGVEECLNVLLHCLCCPPCITSVEQNWLHIRIEDTQMFLSMTKVALALPILAVMSRSVPPCFVNHASQEDQRLHLPDGLSTNCDWCVGSCVHLHQLGLLLVDLEPCSRWCGLQESGLVLQWLRLCDRRARSSAELKSSSCVQSVPCTS